MKIDRLAFTMQREQYGVDAALRFDSFNEALAFMEFLTEQVKHAQQIQSSKAHDGGNSPRVETSEGEQGRQNS